MTADIFVGGIYRAQIWLRDSTGYMTGDQTTLANAATTSAIVLDGVNATTAAQRPPVYVDFIGGDEINGTMGFGSTSYAPFDLTFDNADADQIVLLHGTAVDTTDNSEYPMYTGYTNAGTIRNAGLMITQKKINRDGSDGGSGFIHTIFPFVQILVRRAVGGFQAKTQFIYGVTPFKTTRTPFGQLFSALGMSIPLSQTDHYHVESTSPVHWTAARSDGIITTFITGYRPLSSTVTIAASPNHFKRNGANLALTSISTTTGVATMPSVGSAGDTNVLMYETNFVAI